MRKQRRQVLGLSPGPAYSASATVIVIDPNQSGSTALPASSAIVVLDDSGAALQVEPRLQEREVLREVEVREQVVSL